MTESLAVASTIWEKCLSLNKCIKIGWPINKKICVGVKACLRLIEKNGSIILQVEANGNVFEYNLTNACHAIFSIAVGHIQICIETQGPQKVRLQAKACIGYGPINKCWDIWGTDIAWLTAAEFAALDLAALDLTPQVVNSLSQSTRAVAFEDEFQPLTDCDCEE